VAEGLRPHVLRSQKLRPFSPIWGFFIHLRDEFGKIRHNAITMLTQLFAHRHARILKFLISGGSAAVVDLGLLYLLTDIFHLWYLLSACLAFVAAFAVSFSLQKFWTFSNHDLDLIHRQLIMYFVLALIGLGINTTSMYLLVDHVGLHYLGAQIITSAFIAVGNFFAYKHFIFIDAPVSPTQNSYV
jgi:putative flippase GtrA